MLWVTNSVVFRDVWVGAFSRWRSQLGLHRSSVFLSHIFSQASQNITVKVRVDCSVRRNKFMVDNPLHTKKTTSMLFVELRICRTFFALGDCGLFHCDNCCFASGALLQIHLLSPFMILEIQVEVGSSLAFSYGSRHTFKCNCSWSFAKSQGTHFAAVQRMFKFSVEISWQTP
jgi:hypothetical protein